MIDHHYDKSGMFSFITNFGDQWNDALASNRFSDYSTIKNQNIFRIFVAGMGGSAIAGEVIARYCTENLQMPLLVIRDYKIGNLLKDDLVICTSYSGNTEETLMVLQQAIKKGVSVVGISSGGKLLRICKEKTIPHYLIPSGFPPRAAFGYSLITLAGVISEIIPDLVKFYHKLGTAQQIINVNISKWSNQNDPNNLAIEIAEFFTNKIPLIYTEPGFWESVGTRWQGQISENAKVLAYSSAIPEMNHNEIVGYDESNKQKSQFRTLILRRENTHPRVLARMEFIVDMLGKQAKAIDLSGHDSIATLISAFQLADFVSFYLAMLQKVDPGPVKIIEGLKKHLSITDTS